MKKSFLPFILLCLLIIAAGCKTAPANKTPEAVPAENVKGSAADTPQATQTAGDSSAAQKAQSNRSGQTSAAQTSTPAKASGQAGQSAASTAKNTQQKSSQQAQTKQKTSNTAVGSTQRKSTTSTTVKQGTIKGTPVTQGSAKTTTAKQDAAKATTAKQDAAKATTTKQDTAKATTAKQATAKATTTKQDTAKATTAKQDTAKATTTKQEAAKATTTKQDAAKATTAKQDTAKATTTKQDAAKATTTKQDAAKATPAKQDTAKATTTKQDTAKATTAKQDAAKATTAKQDAAKATTTKQGTAKTTTAKQDAAKASTTKQDTAKATPAKQDTAKQPESKKIEEKSKESAVHTATAQITDISWMIEQADASFVSKQHKGKGKIFVTMLAKYKGDLTAEDFKEALFASPTDVWEIDEKSAKNLIEINKKDKLLMLKHLAAGEDEGSAALGKWFASITLAGQKPFEKELNVTGIGGETVAEDKDAKEAAKAKAIPLIVPSAKAENEQQALITPVIQSVSRDADTIEIIFSVSDPRVKNAYFYFDVPGEEYYRDSGSMVDATGKPVNGCRSFSTDGKKCQYVLRKDASNKDWFDKATQCFLVVSDVNRIASPWEERYRTISAASRITK